MSVFSNIHIGLRNGSRKHYKEERECKEYMIQPNDLRAAKKALGAYIFTIFPIVSYTFVFRIGQLCVLQWTLCMVYIGI